VADKRHVRKSIKDLQRVKTWQLLVLLVLVGFVAATFLRLNNIGMVERRAAVIASDDAGDSENTIRRLYDLQHYVSGHMNTDMGKGVYLEAAYKRDTQKVLDNASADSNPNGNIYKKAQEVCAPKFSNYSAAYLQCTTNELAKYPAAGDLLGAVKLPSASSYLHDFVSPIWSPDFAGWTVLVAGVILLMIVARLISLGVLRVMLSRHYKSV